MQISQTDFVTKLQTVMRAFIVTVLFFMFVVLPGETHSANSKGIGLLIKDRTGKKVGLYKESHALLIGVFDYNAGWPDLESVSGEVEMVEETLQRSNFQVIKVLNPDSDRLRGAFKDFIERYGFDRDNRLLFFFSGHGYTRQNGRKGYLVPSDAPDPRRDDKGFVRKALGMGQILAWAKRIEAKHVLFLFDSCFSGTIFKAKALPKHPPHISDITSRSVRQFITAGSAGEEVPAKSVFSPLFIRALRGNGDMNGDGYVTGTELGMYIHDEVLSYETGQTPQYGKIKDPYLDEGDFVFSLSSSGAVVERPSESGASLMIQSNLHGATVLVDGRRIGKTPLEDFSLASGKHLVRVEKKGYESYQSRIRFQPGRAHTLFVDLSKKEIVYSNSNIKPASKIGKTWQDPITGMEFVWVEGGCYKMGCGPWTGKCLDDEKPVHEVCLDGFWLGKHEVKQGQWKKVMEKNPAKFSKGDNYPVEKVSWNDAKLFIEKLNQRSGWKYQYSLPSEAQWEYACRSGGKYDAYAGGSDVDKIAWYSGNSINSTHIAGTKESNGIGIYDMSGNIWEWCEDIHDTYSKRMSKNPINLGDNSSFYFVPSRVTRGGSWNNAARYLRCSGRGKNGADSKLRNVGLRLLRKN